MKKTTLLFFLLISAINFAQNSVTIDGSKTWNAYVNAFNTSDQSYAFGFAYTIADAKTTVSSTSLTLQPNFAIWAAENSNSAWFDDPNTPNKYIEVNSYVEDNSLAGADLTFSGNIDSHTISSDYTVIAFIKALDPNNGFATVVNKTVELGSSATSFSVSATGAELVSGYVIQYGFSVTGPLGNPENESSLGSVIVSDSSSSTSNEVTIDGSKTWNAYVNAFNTSDQGYAFGFAYTIADAKTTVSSTSLTLQPNFAIWTAENSNSAWFDDPNTPNKFIEVSSYVEDNSLAATDLTFSGNVDSHTISSDYTVIAFIKALDPNNGFATVVNKTQELGSSATSFSVSATGAELVSGYVIQYGFSVTGPLGNPENESSLGSVIVSDSSSTASVEDNKAIISMYPNPAINGLKISAEGTIDTVYIYNVLGKKIMSVNVNNTQDDIDISNLTSGVYLIKFTVDGRVGTSKFIKQ